MKATETNCKLPNGKQIPSLGFGTWQIPSGKICFDAVSRALEDGYRHIDTAFAYDNEASVGDAIRESHIERSKVFVTSKLPAEVKDAKSAALHFEKTMQNLQLDYLDLYLIHAPRPWAHMHEANAYNCNKENRELWKLFEELYIGGRCKSIGVSNFEICDLNNLFECCAFVPMVNQIRYFVGNTQNELVEFCHTNNILVEAYSPLATGKLVGNNTLKKIAEKYSCSTPQLCIKYVLQKGIVALPKAVKNEHISANTMLEFEISEADMSIMDGLKYRI